MKHIQITLSALFILAMSHTIGAQMDTSEKYLTTDHSVFQFQYAGFDKMYTLRTDIAYLNIEEEEDLRVYLIYDEEEESLNVPHHEDIKALSLQGNFISYGFNAADELEVYLLNPRGGTPWSTLSFTHFSVHLELSKGEYKPSIDSLAKRKE